MLTRNSRFISQQLNNSKETSTRALAKVQGLMFTGLDWAGLGVRHTY